MGRVLSGAVLAIGLSLSAGAALADRIDGDWCSPDGAGHFRIDGPTIETVTGRVTQGLYDRHAFSYTIPEGDPGAGGTVDMRLLGEEAVQVWFTPDKSVVWNRCKPIS